MRICISIITPYGEEVVFIRGYEDSIGSKMPALGGYDIKGFQRRIEFALVFEIILMSIQNPFIDSDAILKYIRIQVGGGRIIFIINGK